MEIILGFILAIVLVSGGVALATHMTAGARQHIPEHTRQRARTAGRRVRTTGTRAQAATHETVRSIFAKAAAQNWLENKQAKRARKAAAPPREPRPRRVGPAASRGLKAIGRGIGMVVKPRSTEHVPPVPRRDDEPQPGRRGPLQAVPEPKPAGTRPAQPSTQPEPATRPAQPRQVSTERTIHVPAGTPSDHAAIAHRVATFEPESDADLLQFMTGEAAGQLAYSQAMEQQCDHLLNGVGLDPQSVELVHSVAEAHAECAAIMARAQAKFMTVYQGVREDVANGVVLPYRGRWMTGEGA